MENHPNPIIIPRVEPVLRPELEKVMLGLMDSTNSTPSRKRKRTEPSILDDAFKAFKSTVHHELLSVYELRETRNSSTLRQKYQQLVNREACSTHAPMETVIGLNLDLFETCLFTKSVGGEGQSGLNKFIHETLNDAVNLVALRFEEHEYQYTTMSAYSPTISELPLTVEQQEPTKWPSVKAAEWKSNRATEGTSISSFDLIYSTPTNTEIKKPLRLPCILLNTHSANEDFCGREDILERLATELLPSKSIATASGSGLRQFALCGFGGIGKTEIAREFSRRHKGSFDAVFWVIADEISKLDHYYQEISLALGLEDLAGCKSQVVTRGIVKGWLSNPRKHLSGSEVGHRHVWPDLRRHSGEDGARPYPRVGTKMDLHESQDFDWGLKKQQPKSGDSSVKSWLGA